MNPPVNRPSASSPAAGEQSPQPPKSAVAKPEAAPNSPSQRQGPIPPPNHPKQYRAIGLIAGRFQPSEEKITQGLLLTAEGTAIDTVLLGRMISIVKNHLDLTKPHLWVVYPRTRQEDDQLHVQIVGVWEPETLQKSEFPPEEPADTAAQPIPVPESGYFSIRGEVVFYSLEKEVIIIKIRQSPKQEGERPRFFKLKLQGTLSEKPLRHFWDLQVQLQDSTLVIQEGTDLGPAFKPKKPFQKGKKPWSKQPKRPFNRGDTAPAKPALGSKPVPKPKKGE